MLGSDLEVYVAREDGSRFNEHQLVETPRGSGVPAATECYLESEEGSTFVIHYGQIGTHRVDWAVDVLVDGQLVERSLLRRDLKSTSVSTMFYKEGRQTMGGKLTFGRLVTTDKDEEVSISKQQMDEVGKIVIEFWRGKRGKRLPDEAPPLCKSTLGVAHERTKKLGGCASATDAKRASATTAYVSFKNLDSTAHHVFIFTYRTKPILQMMNIIKTSPAAQQITSDSQGSKTVTTEVDIIELSASEDESDEPARESKSALKRRIQYLEASQLSSLGCCEEQADHMQEQNKKWRNRAKKQKVGETEVHIDLTADTDEE